MEAVTGRRMAKRMRVGEIQDPNPFELLSEEILFEILDLLEASPVDKKSFSLVSRSFYAAEARHRRSLRPLRADLLPNVLLRYDAVECLDLRLCPRVTDASLSTIACNLKLSLRAVDLSGSRCYSQKGIESLANGCGELREIDLSNGVDLTDEAASAIGKMGKLERVKLGRCKKITDLGIGCIAVGCADLKVLSLKGCVGVTDLGVALIAFKCRKLESLDVSYTMITKKCLSGIMQLPNLKDLSMAGCLGIDDMALLSLKQGWKSLQTLDMSNCKQVTQAGVSSILKKIPSLCELNLSHCSLVNFSMQTASKLNSIKLDGCPINTAGLKSIANSCNSLKELSLSKCSGVTDEGLSAIVTKHKGLEKIDVTCCRNITDRSLTAITSSCASLLSLRMESCTKLSSESFALIGRNCPKLEELDLTDNDLDDQGLRALAACTKLKSLKIGICLKITDEGLIQIGKSCAKLQELDLYRSVGITDKGIMVISQGCPNLEIINLAYCTHVTNKSLLYLSKCTKLNTMEIRGCPHVTSVGISEISVGCRQLSKLDVKKCHQVGDSAMLSLARFSHNLRQINLSYSSVTDVGLLALASINCLQNVTMIHVSGISLNGLSGALLVCGSLTKVKLHSSFRPFVSQVLIRHVEMRGCVFQWMNKPFQGELESSEVWKQQSQDLFVE
ncbi:hypothetical protein LUZ60_015391 [Juncus effusus]|nr:hypothetical protein LUZ60_015391 [Juncus effusus]